MTTGKIRPPRAERLGGRIRALRDRLEHESVVPGIITHRLPLKDAPRGYEIFEKKLEDCRNFVLAPDAAA